MRKERGRSGKAWNRVEVETDAFQFNKLILTGLGLTSRESVIYSMPEHAIQLVSVIAA